MKFRITVKPNSKNDSVEKVDGELVVRTKAPAVEGKANEAVIKLLAKYFKVPKSCIKIVRGANSRYKFVEVLD